MDLLTIDDTEIPNEEILYRRIHPSQIIDENLQWRPSSGAFKAPQMSVHLASKISPENALALYPEHSLVSFTAGKVRDLGCILAKVLGDPDPSHALVCPENHVDQCITRGTAKKIAQSANWVKLNKSNVPS